MIRIGVDPGCTGALVVYDADADAVLDARPMPVYAVGSSSRVNAAALTDFLSYWKGKGATAFVELVGAMPGQGVTSMFNFGHATGTVMGVIAGLHIPHTIVTPQAWKNHAGLMGKDKDAARGRAIQLWPHWRDLDLKGKGQALADAALIARYGADAAAREPTGAKRTATKSKRRRLSL